MREELNGRRVSVAKLMPLMDEKRSGRVTCSQATPVSRLMCFLIPARGGKVNGVNAFCGEHRAPKLAVAVPQR